MNSLLYTIYTWIREDVPKITRLEDVRLGVKSSYIDDAYNHISSDGYRIDVIKYYDLLSKGSNVVDVNRRIILGIIAEDRSLSRALTIYSRRLNIEAIDLRPILKSPNIDKCIKYCDVILYGRGLSIGLEDYSPAGKISFLEAPHGEIYLIKDKLLISIDSNIVDMIGGLLYITRPILRALGEPVLVNDIEFLSKPISYRSITPVDRGLKRASGGEIYGFIIGMGDYGILEVVRY